MSPALLNSTDSEASTPILLTRLHHVSKQCDNGTVFSILNYQAALNLLERKPVMWARNDSIGQKLGKECHNSFFHISQILWIADTRTFAAVCTFASSTMSFFSLTICLRNTSLTQVIVPWIRRCKSHIKQTDDASAATYRPLLWQKYLRKGQLLFVQTKWTLLWHASSRQHVSSLSVEHCGDQKTSHQEPSTLLRWNHALWFISLVHQRIIVRTSPQA